MFSNPLLLLHVRELVVVGPIHLEALIKNQLKSGPRLLACGKREVVPALLSDRHALLPSDSRSARPLQLYSDNDLCGAGCLQA